jgi:hypothetical protein
VDSAEEANDDDGEEVTVDEETTMADVELVDDSNELSKNLLVIKLFG